MAMQSFLADIHIAVVSIPEPDRGPLTVPIWYWFEPDDEIKFVTFRDSKKARLLKVSMRISLCVQDEEPPYRFVSVEGPVISIEDADLEEFLRPLARRYLGIEGGDQYVRDTYPDPADPGEVLVTMRVERWLG